MTAIDTTAAATVIAGATPAPGPRTAPSWPGS